MSGLRHRVAPVLLLLLAGAAAATPVWAEPDTQKVASGNTSYVKSDASWLRQAVERAEEAIAEDDWDAAVRWLQKIVDTAEDPDDPGAVVPHVLPVFGTVVYEGAWIVAHHRILKGGRAALDAYGRIFGSEAARLLERGVREREPRLLAEAVDRFLPLPDGRRAALLLADLALERGDRDSALGWLERLQDVEEVSEEPAADLAPWTRARVRLMAATLARPEKVSEAEALLAKAAATGAPDEMRLTPIGARLRFPCAPLEEWTTTGGGPARDRVPPAVGHRLELTWFSPALGREGVDFDEGEDRRGERPSPWLPPRAVVSWPLAFVSDGARLFAWNLDEKRLAARPHLLSDLPEDYWIRPSEEEAREELGLLEGFSLTLGSEDASGGRILYAAVPDLSEGREGWSYDAFRSDALEAVRWTGRRFERLWRIGGTAPRGGMPLGTRLYGAPLLYRGRLWIAGINPSTDVQAEAWLFGLSPDTGAVEVRTFLGTGGPARARRPDEGIPSSPAAANGRVVVSTSLGIVAAVDARTGRPVWLYRNDRGVKSGGRPTQRLGREPDTTRRESGFVNQPPLLVHEHVIVAPTDGPYICCLFDRPRGAGRTLVNVRRDAQLVHRNFTAEQVAGVLTCTPEGGRPLLVVVGKGKPPEGQPPAPIAKGLDPLTLATLPWEAYATTGYGAEPYGLALVTEGEVLIPTRYGIGIYDLVRGRDLATIDVGAVSSRLRELLPTDGTSIFGNLVPVPGRGVLTLNASQVVFWKARKAR